MNQLPSHQTIPDHNQPLFPGTRTEPNALSYLGHSSGFNGKFMSNENLSIDNRTNQSAASVGSTTASISSAQSQLQSGFQMFKLLRDAEKKGFTADDIEIALTFNSTSPLDWLDENWNNMIETVLTLSNNQLVQNEKKRLGKKYKLTAIDLVTTKDAKLALRLTKGNIWQAIDKCVQRKEEDKSDEKKDVKSFSLDIEESGSGKSNMDAVPIALLTNQNQQNQESIRLLQCSSSSLRNDKNELKADEITLSRSSSSSGEYFSEPSDDNEDEMREKINVGTNVNDEDEDEDEDDDRLVDIEVKYLDAVNEVEEIEENILIEEEEEDIEDDEENVDEIDGDEDEENEELVRLRSDSVEDKETDDEEDNDNEDRDYDEDEDEEDDDKEMEDYENLRKSLEQRLSQLGINSIDGYNDDSDEDGNHEDLAKSDKSQEEDEEINRDFEILNRDDFDSNDSDKWSQQSEEDESNHEPIKESMETLKTSSQSETTINITESSSSKEHQKVNQEKQSDNQETQSIGNIENPLEKKVTKSLKKKVVPLTNLKEKVTVSEADGSNGKSTLLPVTPITELPVIDKESLNPHFGYARSAYECELCAGSFHIRDMVSMISCTHKACVNCLRQYFSVQIREASVFIITCPFCSEPVISSDDEDSVCDYLSLLDQLVKSLVSADLHELWQRKVRDKVLSKDPSFRWCTNCSSGFIASNPAAKTITCPDCKIVNCASCHKIWEDQHTGITCDQFTEWKRLNDPEYSDNQLELHLKQFGIDCPNCNFHYELSKGGCMHFHCVQCSHDFCGGCRQTFRLGSKCKISNWCDKLGLHAHPEIVYFIYEIRSQ
ncbi:MATH and LRR domain-containing protein PFE0570w-like [Panonychus citri]|uniref:MATH and LRR domain-containing protein PFE0570w-like n=1 Tax=Panonychus citri TaxID=50023 RepID=UPI0023079A59|nr:MATH and LRR domain-containing protein PFE0570w-like [Panonychus citri]